ncbi:DUF2147 domain-containing protein [Chitinimonas koreensis]|uniref:DUF2147 domain-containing protein n=1 Tax=Chitinimonas koreensis TaxID=356302 RepID=UPI00040C6632|nr:DUF2147 domain-containing protein [Chitinimonas koreensis]QNM97967.1 DUF2147 domain-containing protein [Chitinimonas koreensis]
MPITRPLLAGLVALAATAALADATPVGTWKNVSDKTGKPEALIQIWDEGGVLHGKLVKLFDSKDTLCTKCKGDKKNKPLIGLEIIWGVKQDGDEWNGGKILDPDNGDIYSVKMETADGGQKLKVRGFMGFSLLGRTQTWLREQ